MYSALLAHGSQIRERLKGGLCGLLGISSLTLVRSRIDYDKMDAFLLGPEGFPPKMLDLITWEVEKHLEAPRWDGVCTPASIYVAHAPEIVNVPKHRQQTFQFAAAKSWQETALRVLRYVGWSPESAQSH